MPSIFDTLLGRNQGIQSPPIVAPQPGQSPSMLSLLDDTPSARDTLMGLSQGLISAGAPSPYPVDFGQVFGKAVGGALTATEGAQDKNLKRALVRAQVEKANSDIANDRAWQEMFKSPAAAAGSGPLAPPAAGPLPAPGGGPSNPTNPGNLANGQGGYQSFPTPEAGVAAAIQNVQRYPAKYNNGQPMSLLQIGQAWAPKDDGKTPQLKGNDPAIWAKNVAAGMGVDPNAPIDFSNPAMGHAFAKAVHTAEHPAGSSYTPDVYARGTQMAYDGAPSPQATAPPTGIVPIPNTTGVAQPTPIPNAVPGQAVAQPVQAGPPVQTLPQVIQNLPPAVRQMMGAMPRKDALPLLMKYADPETHVAIDTTTGQIVFAPKTDNSGRYQPVDAMKLDIEKQNAESQRRQAAAREESNRIRGANEPMQPPAVPGGAPTPTPGFPEAKGAITGAEETAKVAPALLKYQGEEAIKDHQLAQGAAAKARASNTNLSQLTTLLDGINTGKMKGTTTELKAYAKGAGIDLDALGIKDDVAPIQAANKLLGQMALELRSTGEGGGMPGSMSDADRQFLVNMTPGVETTPEGRKLIVDYMKKLNQRTLDVAKIKNDYVRSGDFTKDPAGMWAKVSEFADSHPMFSDKDKLPTPSTVPAGSLDNQGTVSAIDQILQDRKKNGAR